MPTRRHTLLGLCAASWLLAQPAKAEASDRDWFIFLERGRPTPPDKALVEAMQRGHIDNFGRLFGLGRLFAAGPLQDPSGHRRGVVVVKAQDLAQLNSYFEADDYVRAGHMTVNALPVQVRAALHTDGIDLKAMAEGRILLLGRPGEALNAAERASADQLLQRLLDQGLLGAWYQPESGALADIVFSPAPDEAALRSALAAYPGLAEKRSTLDVWRQWFSKGVLR